MAGEGGTDLGAGQQAGDTARLEGEELKVVDVRDTKTQVLGKDSNLLKEDSFDDTKAAEEEAVEAMARGNEGPNLFEHKLPPFPWWRVVGMVVCGVVLVPVRAVLTLLVLLLAWLVSAMGLLCRDKETMSTQPQVQANPLDPGPSPSTPPWLSGCPPRLDGEGSAGRWSASSPPPPSPSPSASG